MAEKIEHDQEITNTFQPSRTRVSLGKTRRSRITWVLVQILSTTCVLLALVQEWSAVNPYVSTIFSINAGIFTIFLLGTNITIFLFKNSKSISLSEYLLVMATTGGALAVIVGYVLAYTRFPLYSTIVIVILATLNITITQINHLKKYHLDITIGRHEVFLILFFLAFLAIRLSLLTEEFIWLDDELYARSIDQFLTNYTTLSTQVYSPYYEKSLDWYSPWGFPIIIGVFLKCSGTSTIFNALLVSKTYLIVLNSFIIFPVYLCLTRFTKKKTIASIITIMIVFNQWIILESPFLLLDGTHLLFFSASVYYLLRFLSGENGTSRDAVLAIVLGSVAGAIRPNGFVQMGIVLFLFIGISAIKAIKKRDVKWLGNLPLVKNIDVSRFKDLGRLCFLQGLFIVLFSMLFQIDYLIRNGLSMFEFATKSTNFAFFNEGNAGQFTRVDYFTLSWLIERLSINLPFYILHFTQLTGFIHNFHDMVELKLVINGGLSIAIFSLGTVANVYFWIKHFKTNTLLVFIHASLLIGLFVPVILWGETYFQLHRTSLSQLILFFPPMAPFFQDILKSLHERTGFKVNMELISCLCLGAIAATVLYGSIGFFLPLAIQRDTMTVFTFLKWQFWNIPL